MTLSFHTSEPLTVSTQPFETLETTFTCPLGLWFCNHSELPFIHNTDRRKEFNVPSPVLCSGAGVIAELDTVTQDFLQRPPVVAFKLSISFETVVPGNASDHGDMEP